MKPDGGSPGPRAPIINDRHPLGHVGPAIAISKGFFFFFWSRSFTSRSNARLFPAQRATLRKDEAFESVGGTGLYNLWIEHCATTS